MKDAYDLLVSESVPAGELASLGWAGACFTGGESRNTGGLDSLTAKIVSGDVRKNARDALFTRDLAYYALSSPEANRRASECWELDSFIVSDEYVRDERPGKKPALDFVSMKNMAERGIVLLVPFTLFLRKTGYLRARSVDTLVKTVRLARKAGVGVIPASGADNVLEARSPEDVACFGEMLGVPARQAGKSASMIISKSRERRDGDVIVSGLRVVDWGGQKPLERKRMFGWY
ncbi:MAG: RNase P subunit p30 family protein [Candidatus Altiarchaeota archaeon]